MMMMKNNNKQFKIERKNIPELNANFTLVFAVSFKPTNAYCYIEQYNPFTNYVIPCYVTLFSLEGEPKKNSYFPL